MRLTLFLCAFRRCWYSALIGPIIHTTSFGRGYDASGIRKAALSGAPVARRNRRGVSRRKRNPTRSASSSQATHRLRRFFFLKNRRCAHFAAPHFRPRPAWLGSRARKVLPYKFSRYERRFQQNKKYPHMEVSIWGYCFYRPRFQL